MYKVIFKNNIAVAAERANNLQHHDIGLSPDKETLQWLALECPDEKTAIEIGEKVLKMVWIQNAA